MQDLIRRMRLNGLQISDAEAVIQRLLPQMQRRLPFWLSVLLALGIAWTLAQLTWDLLPQPDSAPSTMPTIKSDASAQKNLDITQLTDMHLFGKPVPAGNANAPETNLPLTLHGILADDKNHKESRAIIAVSDNDQSYAIGAQLPDGAVIQDIFPDRVLISLNSQVESLRLPKIDLTDGSSNAPSIPGMADPSALGQLRPQPNYAMGAPVANSVGQLRNEIVSHPEKLMDMVRAMPVMDNKKLTGYRVFPVGNSAVFSQLGLKPGDVVTAVNGIPLDNPAESMQVLNNLKTSAQIAITLTRNGQQQTQVVQLQGPNN